MICADLLLEPHSPLPAVHVAVVTARVESGGHPGRSDDCPVSYVTRICVQPGDEPLPVVFAVLSANAVNPESATDAQAGINSQRAVFGDNSMRIVCSAAFVVKINKRRGVTADLQIPGINRSELRAAVLPEYLPRCCNSSAERYALTERLRLRPCVCRCSLRLVFIGCGD